MDKNVAGRYQLFAYTHYVLLALAITWSKAKECGQSTSSKICCSGYREISGTCTECIGYMGKDCSVPCPTGFYGKRCFKSCKCSVFETCNQFVGCMPNSAFDLFLEVGIVAYVSHPTYTFYDNSFLAIIMY
ncbi:platelet endothelial aggregation receptor 1-like [Crassostrea angulata]|uniref:platelet endothelial aggregation receptor 1-like n=1 Tax=Magallana angulata TaxID=2784310 RepID=UPI00148A50F3|nr:platelet endothelial aggregation receptor 1 [Crassostrea gigas]XP_052701814.1 platelet endothelial aggregation receptor 1-like [Crassostrea angulata]